MIRNAWKDALRVSELPGITRAILFYLAGRMDADGGNCYPSTMRIAEETGYSERSVRTHIANAKAAGWLTVQSAGRGMAWRNYQYFPSFPAPASADAKTDFDNPWKGAATDAAANSDNRWKGAAIIDGRVRQELPPTSSYTSSDREKAPDGATAAQPEQPPSPLLFGDLPPQSPPAPPAAVSPAKRKPKAEKPKLTPEDLALAYEGTVVRLSNHDWRKWMEEFDLTDELLEKLINERDEYLRHLPEGDLRRNSRTWFLPTKQWLKTRTQKGTAP
jgi:Helix-turn-helix domain